MNTGWAVQFNVSRMVLYIVVGVLSWFGELPWHALGLLLLWDTNYFYTWLSPKRKAALKQAQNELLQRLVSQHRMPGATVEE